MRKSLIILVFLLIAAFLTCAKNEFDIVIDLTNPSSLSIPYSGYYILEATGDSVPMIGHTPGQYTFTLGKGDAVHGIAYKDTTAGSDILNFRLTANGDEKYNQNITLPTYLGGVYFELEVQ